MFGTYRVILALMVAFGHLAGINSIGAYAVFGFYILSGYLMTLILHSGYGYSANGFWRYALNRFLRIYPLYWASALLTVALILWVGPNNIYKYHNAMYLPADWGSVLQNLFIIFPPPSEPRLTPPAWALTVELFYYLCIGAGLSRTRTTTVFWFASSIFYTLYVNVAGLEFEWRYSLIPAASLPFSTGALIYLFKDRIGSIGAIHNRHMPLVLFGFSLVNYAASRKLGVLDTAGFYVSYALNAMLIATLASVRQGLISRKLDSHLGDFSYPIYLIHLQAGVIVLTITDTLARGQMLFALASLPMVIFISWLIIYFLEKPIEHVRKKVKASA